MDIERMNDIIGRIADEMEDTIVNCMHDNSYFFPKAVKEQLYSGLSGAGTYLTPTYEDDPYFQQVHWVHTHEGVTYSGADGYKAWKEVITPPEAGTMLGLPPRPASVPNLFIDGTFYNTISEVDTSLGVDIIVGGGDSTLIVQKYGEVILDVTEVGIAYFNANYTTPAIEKLYKDCGYV
jgi:hypothetical protein